MDLGLEVSALNLNPSVSAINKIDRTLSNPQVNGAEQVSFAGAVKNAGAQVVNSLQNAEGAAVAGIKGDAGPYEVASSVMQAEQSLRMAIALREKAVASYKEITRMQI